jgi:hypothetical protein
MARLDALGWAGRSKDRCERTPSVGVFLISWIAVWTCSGPVVLRIVDLEPVAGEAADPDDVVAGQVSAAASTVMVSPSQTGLANFDHHSLPRVTRQNMCRERFPRSASATWPVHSDVAGPYRESARQW